MAWFQDLAECDYFDPAVAPFLRAVGWLERGKPFPIGAVDRQVYAKLVELRKQPWQPIVTAGIHSCDLCLYEGEASGTANLFIPGKGVLYVCPELIVHSMNAHGYAPPAEFCAAVLACPPMGSMAYRQAILANGGRLLIQGMRSS
jgi:hypothetical protein